MPKLNMYLQIVTLLLVLLCGLLPAQESLYLDLSGQWQFRIDPDDLGVQEEWFRLRVGDRNWQEIQVPGFWERIDSLAGYDGIAWYRHIFSVNHDITPDSIYLGLGGVDDEFDLWMDGDHVGHFGDKSSGFTYYQRKSIHNISRWMIPGKHLVVLRVVDWQGGGGMHRGPVAIAQDSIYFLIPVERVQTVARKYPRALWPFWVQGYGRAWTVIGLEDAAAEGMVSWDGALGSKEWPFSISLWFISKDGTVYAPEKFAPPELKWSLLDGHLPVPRLTFGDSGTTIRQQFAVHPDLNHHYPEGIARVEYSVHSAGKSIAEGLLCLAVRPYLVQGRTGEIEMVRWNEDINALEINDHFLIWTDQGKPLRLIQLPVATLAVEESPGDVSLFLNDPSAPDRGADSVLRMNAAVAIWQVEDGLQDKPFTVTIPLDQQPQNITPQPAELKELLSSWKEKLYSVSLNIPDRRVKDAYYASLAYILINADRGMPHPGPWAYDLFWYRDTAYMLSALLRNRQFDFARETVKHLLAAQRSSGEFPPIFDLNYRQVGYREWDSQGQALFTLAEFVRFTGETGQIRSHWQGIERGAAFIDSLAQLTADGILPPSWSAEDLGPQEWHHYWDDFWAIRGLQDIAWLAGQIGNQVAAEKFAGSAKRLQGNVNQSIQHLIRENNIHWIPNGPEDLHGSSMARGTTPGLWPGGGLETGDPLVRNSFDYYWQKWVQPYHGAYLHQGKFWPYAFELGTCYIMLDQPQRAHHILQWHLDHQTFPGVFAWGEQLDTTDYTFYAGDIPHGWVAADYIHMVQHLLYYSRGDSAVIGAGISWEWLKTSPAVGINNLPTYFGELSFEVKYIEKNRRMVWKLPGRNFSCQGIILKVPGEVRITKVNLEGKNWTTFTAHEIHIPSDGGMVTAQVEVNVP